MQQLFVKVSPNNPPEPWLLHVTSQNIHSLWHKDKVVSWQLEQLQLYLPIIQKQVKCDSMK